MLSIKSVCIVYKRKILKYLHKIIIYNVFVILIKIIETYISLINTCKYYKILILVFLEKGMKRDRQAQTEIYRETQSQSCNTIDKIL